MDYASIERGLRIDASPEVVYDVISSPAHLMEWWPDEAHATPGGISITFGEPTSPNAHVELLTIVEADAPRRFSFRWVSETGQAPALENSLLVTFDLTPEGEGTLLHVTETGFRERGWAAAVLESTYNEHVSGWGHFLPRLVSYAGNLLTHP